VRQPVLLEIAAHMLMGHSYIAVSRKRNLLSAQLTPTAQVYPVIVVHQVQENILIAAMSQLKSVLTQSVALTLAAVLWKVPAALL
jgi:hypothetical protein